jgi:hypothetical protein
MEEKNWLEIEKRFERLSFDAKVRLIERLVRRLWQEAVDPASFEDGVNAMAADPDVQRELGGVMGR